MCWVNGQSVKSPHFKRKTDCIQWKAQQTANKTNNQLYGDTQKLREKITLEDYSQLWLNAKKSQGVARSSGRNYETYFRVHILKYFLNRDLKTIKKPEIENFQIHLHKDHNAKGTNMIMTMLKSVFKDAVNEGYLLKSPSEFVKKLTEDNAHDNYWTKSEIDQFLRANCKHENYDLFLVATNTGMRRGELAGLCWDRVDFGTNTITVTRTRDRHELKERTKTNIKRVIPMNGITKDTLLKVFMSRTHDVPFVFLNKDGRPIDPHHINRTFNRAQEKAEIKNQITFHDLRHTFASQFVMSGGDIYDLQKLLGHTNIGMTTRYAHLSMDHLQNAMKDFSLGQAWTGVQIPPEEFEKSSRSSHLSEVV